MNILSQAWRTLAALAIVFSNHVLASDLSVLEMPQLLKETVGNIDPLSSDEILLRSSSHHHHRRHHSSSHSHKHKRCHDKKPEVCQIPCKCKKVIFAKDVNPNGYVITEPGTYCLGEDIVFKPRDQKDINNPKVFAAITIKSSNVTLDLGKHTLSQFIPADPSKQVPFVVGILVPDLAPTNSDPNNPALRSIYIQGDQNALVANFSMFGIRVFANTFDVQIADLTVKNCGTLASKALRPFASYIPHSVADNANFPAGTNNAMQVGGIVIGETNFLGMGPNFFTEAKSPSEGGPQINRVNSLRIENVSSINNFFLGVFVTCATDVAISNSHFDATWSDQEGIEVLNFNAVTPNGGYFVGGVVSADGNGVVDMRVDNCTFNNTQMRGDYTTDYGFGFFAGAQSYDSLNVVYNNCQFNGTSNTYPTPFFFNFTTGFLCGGLVDTTFRDCSFDGTRAMGAAGGFHISGSGGTKGSRNTTLINCTANDTQQIGDQQLPFPTVTSGRQAVGYLFAFAENVKLVNCIANNTTVNGPMDAFGISVGIRFSDFVAISTGLGENAVISGCNSSRTQALNGGQALGYWINTVIPPDVERALLFENCAAEGNIASPGFGDVAGTDSIGCGFFLQVNPESESTFPISFINCSALNNKGLPILEQEEGQNFYSAGFYGLGLQQASFFQSEAEGNIYGFLFQEADRNVVRECRADNNVDLETGIGAGFTDLGFPDAPLGALGTPASPGESTSLFESNRAFANGDNTDDGENGNYNILYSPALIPLPTLNGNLSTATFPESDTFLPTVNVSMTK